MTALAATACAGAAWLRLRAEELAARSAREREGALVEAVRRLNAAARRSLDEVCAEIDRALRAIAPALDSGLIFDEDDGNLTYVGAG